MLIPASAVRRFAFPPAGSGGAFNPAGLAISFRAVAERPQAPIVCRTRTVPSLRFSCYTVTFVRGLLQEEQAVLVRKQI